MQKRVGLGWREYGYARWAERGELKLEVVIKNVLTLKRNRHGND